MLPPIFQQLKVEVRELSLIEMSMFLDVENSEHLTLPEDAIADQEPQEQSLLLFWGLLASWSAQARPYAVCLLPLPLKTPRTMGSLVRPIACKRPSRAFIRFQKEGHNMVIARVSLQWPHSERWAALKPCESSTWLQTTAAWRSGFVSALERPQVGQVRAQPC